MHGLRAAVPAQANNTMTGKRWLAETSCDVTGRDVKGPVREPIPASVSPDNPAGA